MTNHVATFLLSASLRLSSLEPLGRVESMAKDCPMALSLDRPGLEIAVGQFCLTFKRNHPRVIFVSKMAHRPTIIACCITRAGFLPKGNFICLDAASFVGHLFNDVLDP